MRIRPGPDAKKNSQATFTLAGSEIEISYEFGTEGTRFVSKLKGTLAAETLTGTYQPSIAGQDERVDEGTFKATLVK